MAPAASVIRRSQEGLLGGGWVVEVAVVGDAGEVAEQAPGGGEVGGWRCFGGLGDAVAEAGLPAVEVELAGAVVGVAGGEGGDAADAAEDEGEAQGGGGGGVLSRGRGGLRGAPRGAGELAGGARGRGGLARRAVSWDSSWIGVSRS